MSIEKLMLQILASTEGITKEELARATGSNTDTIRSYISANRRAGKRIVDYLIPSKTGKKFFKKEYKIAQTNEEYFAWCLRQLGGNVPPVVGAPRV